MRIAVSSALPAFVVNNMVTVIAVLHVGSELLMFKAGGLKFRQNNRGGKEVNMLIDPLNNLWRGLRGVDKIDKNGNLTQNIWAIRSTAAGFAVWLFGTVTPNKKDTIDTLTEETERYQNSKISYVGHRLLQSLNIFDPSHKRETIGLGVGLAGIFSALSGFTSVDGRGKAFINPTRTIGGVITAGAGGALLFSMTEREGWSRFGATLWARLPFIGFSIHKMIKKTNEDKVIADPALYAKANREWKYYAGGAAGFQAAALASNLFGGVEKLPNGEIVDVKEQRESVALIVKERKATAAGAELKSKHRNRADQETPATNTNVPQQVITKAALIEKLAPEQDSRQAVVSA